jgi:hypothetical protein
LFKSSLGYKQIESVFKTLFSGSCQKKPSDSTIRLWVMRAGYAKLNKELPDGQWMMIGDVTVDIGTLKCLVNVGVNLDVLYEREDITLTFDDLEIIGIHPTQKATGEFAEESFRTDIDRLGGFKNVKGIIIDQGTDVSKGAKLLQKGEEKLKILHDISHKLSLVLERDLKNDPHWEDYTKHLTKTKQLVQQTELAGLQPPKQRSKARFMNVSLYINWFYRVKKSKEDGNLQHIPEERFNEYFGWMSKFEFFYEIIHQKVGVTEIIKDTIRRGGYSMETYEYLIELFDLMPLDKGIHSFICNALDAVYEEVEKLDDEERLPGTTEIAESLFGSHKNHSACGGHGITGNVLTLGALVGATLTSEEVNKTMEETSVQSMLDWVSNKVGDTLAKLRNRFFKDIGKEKKSTDCNSDLNKGQNLTGCNTEMLATG